MGFRSESESVFVIVRKNKSLSVSGNLKVYRTGATERKLRRGWRYHKKKGEDRPDYNSGTPNRFRGNGNEALATDKKTAKALPMT
jgi:hypothetical protein